MILMFRFKFRSSSFDPQVSKDRMIVRSFFKFQKIECKSGANYFHLFICRDICPKITILHPKTDSNPPKTWRRWRQKTYAAIPRTLVYDFPRPCGSEVNYSQIQSYTKIKLKNGEIKLKNGEKMGRTSLFPVELMHFLTNYQKIKILRIAILRFYAFSRSMPGHNW